MKTFTEYISENSILDEASVNRFWQHLTKDSIIGMITADRAFISKEGLSDDELAKKKKEHDLECKRNNEALRSALRSNNFGYVKALGGYVENRDGVGLVTVNGEDTTIVYTTPDKEVALFKLLKKLGEKYNQDSFLFVNKNNEVFWFFCNDTSSNKAGDIVHLGEFTVANIEKYFTRIGKKRFSFKT